MEDFIKSLNLEININKIEEKSFERASQLTYRTTQFNASGIKKTIQQIQADINTGYQYYLVDVKDKFGDYGIVGLMVYKIDEKGLEVDEFLLSCRVLSRDVEHEMIKFLVNAAINNKVQKILIKFESTSRNTPVRKFLAMVGESGNNMLHLNSENLQYFDYTITEDFTV